MRRRDFIKVIAGSAITWPLTTHAQQDRVRRIGVLITLGEDDPQGQQQVQTLLQSLQELGWKRGTNLEIDLRWGGTNNERIQMMAKELVAEQPDVIQVATTPGTAAVLRETRTIPVVFSIVSDPVGSGFVASLSHPGGNATGFINIESSMGGKWVELLKEVAPDVTRVTLLFDPATGPQVDYYRGPIEAAVRSLGISLKSAPVGDVAAIETEIAATAQERHTGLIVHPDIFTYTHRDLIVSLANRANLPAVYPFTVFTSAGGLLSYGVDLLDLQRRAAGYVDRILKGTKPEDLPVQLPTGVWPRNRLAFVGAGAAVARVQVAALFKLIELGLRHQNRPPEEAALAALAMPGDRLADLFSAGRHLATAGCLKLPRRQASIITTQISGHATQILAGCRRQFIHRRPAIMTNSGPRRIGFGRCST